MEPRKLCLAAILALAASATAQQITTSSPQPYVGGTGVLWSHTFRQANAFEARVSLSMDLGANDVLVLKDSSGTVHWTYRAQGPTQTLPASSVDAGGRQPQPGFLSGIVPGDVVTAELYGRSGGHGVTVHDVRWQTSPTYAASSAGSCALDVVIPSGFDDVEGNANTSFPWATTSAMRVMYSYGRESVDFARPVRICGIRYRPDGFASSTVATTFDFRLDVSTSQNSSLALDPIFGNNHGVDRVTVFDGLLTLPANTALGTTPSPFSLEVTFDTPFEWDPRSGSLLFDFRHRGATNSPGSSWDANLGGGDFGRIAALGNGSNAHASTFPSGGGTQNVAMIVDLCLETDVAPASLTTQEGFSSTAYPFSRSQPMRVLYAYDESIINFAGRHKISALSFRTNNGAAFSGASYDLRVTMSTGSNPVNALDPTFDNNHGSDKAVVFEGVHVAGASGVQSAPGPFVLTIPLQDDFEYNPAAGPLLIDLQLLTGSTSLVSWDAALNTEPAYRIFNVASATAATGVVQNAGMVVALHAEPIPTIPEVDDSTFGSSVSNYPWNISGQQRVMYQYASSVIATDRPLFIQHLSWRPNANATIGPVSYTCTVDLSTSAVAVGGMSTTFDTNHGSDRARVFNGTFSVAYQDTYVDPSHFPVSIKLDQPFYYDPANGPLIVDIRMLDQFGDTSAGNGHLGSGVSRFVHLSDANSNVANWPSSGAPQAFGLDLRLSGEGCNATSINYGMACSGSNGTAACVNLGLPTLPSPDFAVGLHDGPINSVGFLVLGVTQTYFPLAVIGAPGCLSLTPGEIGAFGVPTSAAGDASYALPLPGDGSFSGFQFMTQWVSLDLGSNQLGLTYSNAQRHTTCY